MEMSKEQKVRFSDLRAILRYVPLFRGERFVVAVDGARWQAVGPRAGIARGSEVEITGVRGTVLEVTLRARDEVRE